MLAHSGETQALAAAQLTQGEGHHTHQGGGGAYASLSTTRASTSNRLAATACGSLQQLCSLSALGVHQEITTSAARSELSAHSHRRWGVV